MFEAISILHLSIARADCDVADRLWRELDQPCEAAMSASVVSWRQSHTHNPIIVDEWHLMATSLVALLASNSHSTR